MTTSISPGEDEDVHFKVDHLKEDLGTRSARSGMLTFVSQLIKLCVSSVSTIILARLLTPSDYGIVGMVAIVLNFAVMFQYLGLSTATIQWPSLSHKQVSTLFWINVSMSTLIAMLMAAVSPVVAWFFGEPRVIGVTIGYSVAVFITGLWIQHEALLNRQMRFGRLAVIDITSLVSGLVVSIVTAWKGAGYWALVYNQLTVTAVQGVAYWISCGWRPGLPAKGSGVRPLLTFGGHFTGTNLLNFFGRNVDNILIGKFWGAAQLGLYSRAYQLLLLPLQQILNPVAAVALPALSRLTDAPDRYRKAYLSIIEKMAMITMPAVTLACVVSDWLVTFVLGPRWEESGRIFMFLGIGAIMQPITRTSYWLFATQDRTREMVNWGAVSTAISIGSILLGLYWGAIGVAITYGLTELLIITPLMFWFTGRRGPVRTLDFYKTLFPSFCAAAAVLVTAIVARQYLSRLDAAAARLAIAGTLGIFVTLAVFLVMPKGRNGLSSFRQLMAKSFRFNE